jgi:hypothetical protein
MDSALIDAHNHFYRELHQSTYYKSRITHHQDKSKNTTILRDIFYLILTIMQALGSDLSYTRYINDK